MKVRVLVVDDEKDNCEYLRALLEAENYEVTTLTDPRKTIELLAAETFHLVVLDWMMPQLPGSEVLQQIRKVDDDVAVIVATAYPSVDSAVESLRAHVSDYVKKPFEPQSFLASVQASLAQKGLTTDPETELHQAIGRAIRNARKVQDLTLKQLARRTGLSVSLLSQIERAESSASVSSLYRIASALSLRMSRLFGETSPQR